MDRAEHARMRALEDRYWWFVARRTAAARFVRDHAPRVRPLRILDAGCGTGAMLALLDTWPDAVVTALDASDAALGYSRARGHRRLVGGDLARLPFADASFEVVTALDVLEHVPDDRAALAEIARVLVPGGVVVATVPAYRFLWGAHDEALHHLRRYTSAELLGVVRAAGLHVERRTSLLTALFPLAVAARLTARRRAAAPTASLPTVPGALNRVLIALLGAELALARRVSLPFGLSILVVARRPGTCP